jgi:hypothetical protein
MKPGALHLAPPFNYLSAFNSNYFPQHPEGTLLQAYMSRIYCNSGITSITPIAMISCYKDMENNF